MSWAVLILIWQLPGGDLQEERIEVRQCPQPVSVMVRAAARAGDGLRLVRWECLPGRDA